MGVYGIGPAWSRSLDVHLDFLQRDLAACSNVTVVGMEAGTGQYLEAPMSATAIGQLVRDAATMIGLELGYDATRRRPMDSMELWEGRFDDPS